MPYIHKFVEAQGVCMFAAHPPTQQRLECIRSVYITKSDKTHTNSSNTTRALECMGYAECNTPGQACVRRSSSRALRVSGFRVGSAASAMRVSYAIRTMRSCCHAFDAQHVLRSAIDTRCTLRSTRASRDPPGAQHVRSNIAFSRLRVAFKTYAFCAASAY